MKDKPRRIKEKETNNLFINFRGNLLLKELLQC